LCIDEEDEEEVREEWEALCEEREGVDDEEEGVLWGSEPMES
jgi:hypothetical protein